MYKSIRLSYCPTSSPRLSAHDLSAQTDTSGVAIGWGEGGGRPPDSRFVMYGASVHQVMNIHRPHA